MSHCLAYITVEGVIQWATSLFDLDFRWDFRWA